MDDLLIRHGDVIDGTGAPVRRADVAVHGNRVVAIEDRIERPARRVIDASGLVVAPGFIDIKTHSDLTLPLCPRAESRVYQGITTELVGSCGFTAAPVPHGCLNAIAEYLRPFTMLELRETSFGAYMESFPATSVNVAMQVGHNTIRVAVMGLENRPPSSEEQASMARLVDEALEAGAVGLSSGPFTPPGSFAGPEELEGLARVAARRGAGYATHLRDESSGVFQAVAEAIALAERTGVRTRVVHAKVSGTRSWGAAPRFLSELEAARSRGVPIDCDHYPYTTALVPLRNLLPSWAHEGGTARMLERLRDGNARADIRSQIAERGLNAFGHIASWDAVRVTLCPSSPEEVGRTIAQIASNRGSDPLDALCDLIVADRGATRALVASMHEDDVRAFVACPWVLVGSDGRAVAPEGPSARELPHPRSYGTFPRILARYTRELGLLTLPQAVHKMTGAPAAAIGLKDRGILRPGAAADVVLFDASAIAERATFDDPRRYPIGVSHVIVNGVLVIDSGVHTGALPGRLLRRSAG